MKNAIAAIDLGATKTSIALYDSGLSCIAEETVKTLAMQGADTSFKRITETVKKLCAENDVKISASGICTPGPISIKDGTIVYIASIGWRDVPVVNLLEDALGVPAAFENDTNAAAFAERFAGAGKNLPFGQGNLIYITVSTGVGAGIIADDRILHGARDWAGEFGHIIIAPDGRPCGCGNIGCLEMYASGTAIEKEARAAVKNGRQTVLSQLCGGDVSLIDCSIVETGAKQGDQYCLSLWTDMAKYLGRGISILIQLFDPGIITLGGGVTRAWPLFEKSMLDEMKKGIYAESRESVIVQPTPLGQDACRLGAALLALQKIK